VQPGIEPVRITKPVQPRDRDEEGVPDRLGGFGRGEQEVAVGVEGRGVPVVRLGDPIRFTRDDSRDHVTVLHALTVVGSGIKLRPNDIPDIRTK
jgi:hypothetical protein